MKSGGKIQLEVLLLYTVTSLTGSHYPLRQLVVPVQHTPLYVSMVSRKQGNLYSPLYSLWFCFFVAENPQCWKEH